MKPTNVRILQHQFTQYHAEVIMAGQSAFAARWSDKRSQHNFFRLCYIEKGSARLVIDGQTHTLHPGKLYLLWPEVEQSIVNTGKGALNASWCHFRLTNQDQLPAYRMQLPLSIDVPDEQHVIDLFRKMVVSQASLTLSKQLVMHAALLELVACFLDESINVFDSIKIAPDTKKWQEVLGYIDENLHRNIQIEELAKVAYLHPNYFITAFRSLMGCSPIQYVTEQRLSLAKQLLADTTMPIADVAIRAGMLNHYLSRLFKRRTGITPMQYRRIMQNHKKAQIKDLTAKGSEGR
ncbi:AraC family transcriptional regulator [Paenibacillus sp. NPDC058174]|uniref:helix-turn-helix transcriptional regulator n=1 Tax=Paenibacillus sp. NPDC058174 TaxID=3346366 RepID=UPI0036DC2894